MWLHSCFQVSNFCIHTQGIIYVTNKCVQCYLLPVKISQQTPDLCLNTYDAVFIADRICIQLAANQIHPQGDN